VIYAQRLLDWLGETEHETHVVLSSYAQAVIRQELPAELRLSLAAMLKRSSDRNCRPNSVCLKAWCRMGLRV